MIEKDSKRLDFSNFKNFATIKDFTKRLPAVFRMLN